MWVALCPGRHAGRGQGGRTTDVHTQTTFGLRPMQAAHLVQHGLRPKSDKVWERPGGHHGVLPLKHAANQGELQGEVGGMHGMGRGLHVSCEGKGQGQTAVLLCKHTPKRRGF